MLVAMSSGPHRCDVPVEISHIPSPHSLAPAGRVLTALMSQILFSCSARSGCVACALGTPLPSCLRLQDCHCSLKGKMRGRLCAGCTGA